jgi:hypothetical protein
MAARVWMTTTLDKLLFMGGRVRRREFGLQADSILSLSSKLMKFTRILQRGSLDTVSILILAVLGGVRLGSDCI